MFKRDYHTFWTKCKALLNDKSSNLSHLFMHSPAITSRTHRQNLPVYWRVWKYIQSLRHRGTRTRRGVCNTVSQLFYLLPNASAPLLEFTSFHRGCPSPHRLSRLRIGVDHPPRGFSSTFILNPHEPVVKRQVMPDRIL